MPTKEKSGEDNKGQLNINNLPRHLRERFHHIQAIYAETEGSPVTAAEAFALLVESGEAVHVIAQDAGAVGPAPLKALRGYVHGIERLFGNVYETSRGLEMSWEKQKQSLVAQMAEGKESLSEINALYEEQSLKIKALQEKNLEDIKNVHSTYKGEIDSLRIIAQRSDELSKKVEALVDERSGLESKYEERIRDLSSKQCEIEDARAATVLELNDSESEAHRLRDAIEGKVSANNLLNQEITAWRRQVEDYKKINERLNDDIQECRLQARRSEAKLSEVQDNFSRLAFSMSESIAKKAAKPRKTTGK